MYKNFGIIFFQLLLIKAIKPELIEVFKWKQLDIEDNPNRMNIPGQDFVFPSPQHRPYHHDSYHNHQHPYQQQPNRQQQNYQNQKTQPLNFIPYNNLPMGVTHHKNKLFITIPRRREGIPATLAVINLDNVRPGDMSPKITGYPSYDMNALKPNLEPDIDRLVSVYRTAIDHNCNRLWFVDTGMLEYPNNTMQIQPPSIWIIDLNTNQRIRHFQIPTSVASIGRGIASMAVDSDRNSCDDAYGYIPDLFLYGLYVYSYKTNSIWRFQHNYLSFDPISGDFNVGNQIFQWNDGIFSITLGNRKLDGFRYAYFHPLASNSEFVVSTKTLQNDSNSVRSSHGNDFVYLGSRGNLRQCNIHAFDPRTEIIFYAEVSRSGIGCWNTKKEFTLNNNAIIQTDEERMIYPSDVSIDADGTLWMMTNTMPVFLYSTLDLNYYNYKIWKQDTRLLSKNTACEFKTY